MVACLIVLLVATTARGEIKLSPLERYTFADVSEAKDLGDLGSYVLYYWNGMDAIYGKNNTSKVVSLGEIAPPEQAKAEGLAVISETDSTVRIMILYDGIEGGAPEVYELTKTW